MTIRLLMTGKEAGIIIGKGGDLIDKIREESGANIFISDASAPERIITINGQTDLVFKVIELICKRLEDESGQSTLNMIVPASQCGSLIGKGGSRIKEIRKMSGATVIVASDMLPHSTERTVSVSGNLEAITKCISKVVSILMETPPKGPNLQYTPNPGTFLAMAAANLLGRQGGASTLAAIAILAGSQMRAERGGEGKGPTNTQTFDMSIPNDMIGCIIGKGGSKIAEIRTLTGAMITISECEDIGSGRGEKTRERHISITGNSDSVALATSLLNMSLDLYKSTLEERNKQEGEGGTAQGNERRPQAMDPAQIRSKSEALTNAITWQVYRPWEVDQWATGPGQREVMEDTVDTEIAKGADAHLYNQRLNEIDDEKKRHLGVSDEIWIQLEMTKVEEMMNQKRIQREQQEAKRLEEEKRFELTALQERMEREAEGDRKRELQRQLEEARERERQRLEKERRKREKEEQERQKTEAIKERLHLIGLCLGRFKWYKQSGGWRCSAGGHFVSDAQLQSQFGIDV